MPIIKNVSRETVIKLNKFDEGYNDGWVNALFQTALCRKLHTILAKNILSNNSWKIKFDDLRYKVNFIDLGHYI